MRVEKAAMRAPTAPIMPQPNIVQRHPIRSEIQAEPRRPSRSPSETSMNSVATVLTSNLKNCPSSVCPQDWTVKDPRMKEKKPSATTSS